MTSERWKELLKAIFRANRKQTVVSNTGTKITYQLNYDLSEQDVTGIVNYMLMHSVTEETIISLISHSKAEDQEDWKTVSKNRSFFFMLQFMVIAGVYWLLSKMFPRMPEGTLFGVLAAVVVLIVVIETVNRAVNRRLVNAWKEGKTLDEKMDRMVEICEKEEKKANPTVDETVKRKSRTRRVIAVIAVVLIGAGALVILHPSLLPRDGNKLAAYVLNRNAGSDIDYKYARIQGEKLNNINEQLAFCHSLYEAGYDMDELYPEGVEVKHLNLGAYQVMSLAESDEAETEEYVIDPQSVLIFERKEKEYVPAETEDHGLNYTNLYTIKLLPGYLFRYGNEHVAHSYDEATCIVIADSVYIRRGMITEYSTSTTSSSGKTTRYPYYSAVNALSVYDRNDAKTGYIIHLNVDNPQCADEDWFNSNKDLVSSSSYRYRLGSFNTSEIMEQLDILAYWILSE